MSIIDKAGARRLRVFLCHSWQDKKVVSELHSRLLKDGLEPWMDEIDLIPGQNWREEIPKAVQRSDVILACLSAKFNERAGYGHKEIKLALDVADEQPQGTIFLVPVRLEPCDIPERLEHLHWVDYFSDQGYERLIRALKVRIDQLSDVLPVKTDEAKDILATSEFKETSQLQPSDRAQLRRFLSRNFNLEELKNLAFDLSVDFESFPHANKDEFCREFIAFFERRGNITCLLAQLLSERDDNYLIELLARLESCLPRRKVQIIVRDYNVKDRTDFLKELANFLGLETEEVHLLGMLPGSVKLLVGLPEEQALQLQVSQIKELSNGKYEIIAIIPFERLNSEQQALWRLARRDKFIKLSTNKSGFSWDSIFSRSTSATANLNIIGSSSTRMNLPLIINGTLLITALLITLGLGLVFVGSAINIGTNNPTATLSVPTRTVATTTTPRFTKIMTLTGYLGPVTSGVFSPDGKMVATASGKDIINWDITRSSPISTTFSSNANINKVAFSPDGKILASGSSDNTIILWDVSSQQLVGQPLKAHSSGVYSVAFNPDGKILASGSSDNTIILWDVSSQRLIGQPLKAHSSGVYSIAFSPDGKILASSSADKTICLWSVSDEKLLATLSGHTAEVNSIAFNPDGKILASSSLDKTARLWSVSDGKLLATLSGHSDTVTSIAFSPDGKILASSSADKTIRLWSVSDGKLLATLSGHTAEVNSIAFNSDGTMLISTSQDRTAIIWDVT